MLTHWSYVYFALSHLYHNWYWILWRIYPFTSGLLYWPWGQYWTIAQVPVKWPWRGWVNSTRTWLQQNAIRVRNLWTFTGFAFLNIQKSCVAVPYRVCHGTEIIMTWTVTLVLSKLDVLGYFRIFTLDHYYNVVYCWLMGYVSTNSTHFNMHVFQLTNVV